MIFNYSYYLKGHMRFLISDQ